jgi:hypothetical protein
MALRTNDTEVKQIITTTSNTTPFIEAASVLVDVHLTGKGLSDATLKQIEKWWAAHLFAVSDPRVEKTKTGKAEDTFQGKTGMGLNATLYGQQVLLFDTTGTLANAGKRPATFETIQSPTEATPAAG